MTEDSFSHDGTVTMTEYIKHYRTMPLKKYEIMQAFDEMSDEEQIKVLKYVTRITNKRITFRALQKPMSKRTFLRAIKRIDSRNQD